MTVEIARLNKTMEDRDFMVQQILYREGKGKTNAQYDRLEEKLNKLPYATLDSKLTKIAGD